MSGKARLKNVPKVSADTGLRTTVSITEPAQITSKRVSASGTGTLVAANALNFSTKYYDPSSASADSDGNVKETIALGALTHSSSDPLSAADMATYFNEEFKKLRSVNVRATAHNEVRVENIDSTLSGLLINNVAITYSNTTNLGQMIQAINAKSDQSGVRANWLGETGLVLSNASGHEGKNIELGLSGGATGLTALGLVTGVYEGSYEISAAGEQAVSNTFSSATQSLNAGSAFNITVTPAGGSATTVTVAAGSDTPQGIVNAINTITGVEAVLLSEGSQYRITLRDTTSAGRQFSVSSTVTNYKPVDAQGRPLSGSSSVADTDFGFNDLNNQTVGLNKPSEIALTLSARARQPIRSLTRDQKGSMERGAELRFVTGQVGTDFGKTSQPMHINLPGLSIPINFHFDTVYTITETSTDTVVATRLYTRL